MKRNIFLLMLCLFGLIGAMAQTKTATGVVTDQAGEAVIGASVIVKGTTNGTITDLDGKFTLGNVKNGDIIQISFVGYKTQEIKFAGQTLNVILHDDTEVLDEVVVTGYGGSQKRATLTTAISKLDNSVLKNAAFSNAGQSLQGSVTGLRVVNTTGQPGTNPDITLRGGATITGDNSNALVVVDGIVRNSMSDVNPSDIESIQILKDAASTAIYGARANGGVILIETKSGKEGKTSVNYKFKIGKNFTRKGYEFVNAEDYIYYNRLGMLRTNQARDGRMGVHVAHDALVGNGCIIGNSTKMAGEIIIDDNAIVSANVLMHQFCHVGSHVMIQGGCRFSKDIPPYIIAGREPIAFSGINIIGLRRRGFANEVIESIHNAYRIIYQSGLNTTEALKKIEDEFEKSPEIDYIIDFIRNSERGIIK